jgi:hypothetical protein
MADKNSNITNQDFYFFELNKNNGQTPHVDIFALANITPATSPKKILRRFELLVFT